MNSRPMTSENASAWCSRGRRVATSSSPAYEIPALMSAMSHLDLPGSDDCFDFDARIARRSVRPGALDGAAAVDQARAELGDVADARLGMQPHGHACGDDDNQVAEADLARHDDVRPVHSKLR